jgi:hypothetical protein
MVILGLLVVAAVLLIGASLRPLVAQSPSDMGSVLTVRTLPSGMTAMTLRKPSGQLTTITRSSGTWLTSRDGALITASDVMPGDRITGSSRSGTLTDVSQQRATLGGIIASAPGVESNDLIVQSSAGIAIVAQLASSTRINGAPMTMTNKALLMDSEAVTVRGVLDSKAGVMTITYDVTSGRH